MKLQKQISIMVLLKIYIEIVHIVYLAGNINIKISLLSDVYMICTYIR